MYLSLGSVTTVHRLRFQTDAIYWQRELPLGCWRGNQTHRKYLKWLKWPGQPPEDLAWQYIFMANIHYATQTEWWVLKLKTKPWINSWREECPFYKRHLFTDLVPNVLKMYTSLLNIHPCGLVISYCIIILDDHWFRKWLVTYSVPDNLLNHHCFTPSRPLGPTEETL